MGITEISKVITLGIIFGFILRYAKLNRFDTIVDFFRLRDMTLPKALLLAIGVGTLLPHLEVTFCLASFHVKPLLVSGIIIGGLLFGIGMALLGYCPGTLAVSLGEGYMDALLGIIGGLLAGWLFSNFYPKVKSLLGPNLGKPHLFSLINSKAWAWILLIIISASLIALAIYLRDPDGAEGKDHRWLISGILLGILNPIIFLKLVSNRPIGASTSYPYLADLLLGGKGHEYFQKIAGAGRWEAWFLLGAMLSALLFSFLEKNLSLKVIPERWKELKGENAIHRGIWAFIGGFILILGARIAGGCTSGHILSGGMQMSVSSWLFGIIAILSAIMTAKLFYKDKERG